MNFVILTKIRFSGLFDKNRLLRSLKIPDKSQKPKKPKQHHENV